MQSSAGTDGACHTSNTTDNRSLTSLHELITERMHALNEPSKQDIQKYVQKLANAAHMSSAECALLREQTRFLTKMNNEAKPRRSTKSEVVGNAKVMSHEDIKDVRAKRVEKAEAAANKGKRGRKRKRDATEVDVAEQRAPVARMI
jgi:hypothetical protein